MEEIPKQPDQDSSAREAKDAAVEERSWNLGCGLALVIVGAGGLAQKMAPVYRDFSLAAAVF
jgi:hypothetical protein